ncbi:MAG TPA: polysaccharide biosynthesis/export family protein, partial [Polyangiaceae bacterium]|nr:polysaccharide biosynthesis/export family protein [Polyangiaceae bacterium]
MSFRSPCKRISRARFGVSLLGAVALSLTVACSSVGQFVWYSQLPRSEWDAASGEYVIGVGDNIAVRVYEQEGLSGSGKIRSDGRMSLPLVGDVVFAGKHPSAIAKELETRLKPFVVAPRVTVNVES